MSPIGTHTAATSGNCSNISQAMVAVPARISEFVASFRKNAWPFRVYCSAASAASLMSLPCSTISAPRARIRDCLAGFAPEGKKILAGIPMDLAAQATAAP